MHPSTRLLRLLTLSLALSACSGSATPTPPSAPPTAATATATPVPSTKPSAVPAATPMALGDRLIGTITVPLAPCALATDGSSAWITGSATGVLVRVDPATGAVADSIDLGGTPCGVAVGPDGRIWVAVLRTGEVVAVDPVTKSVTSRIEGVGPALWDLKGGFGSIWVADRTAKALLRIDPATAKVVATIPIGPRASGLAVMPGGVWVADDTDSELRRIDPATNTVATTVKAAGAPSWFSDDGATNLLVSERGSGKVVPVDPVTGALGEPTTGWDEPLDGTVVGTQAWVPDGSGRLVGVEDLTAAASGSPASVVRYALPGAVNPFVAEPAFGEVWILDFSGTNVWRIRP
jgi:streptogramin lyase